MAFPRTGKSFVMKPLDGSQTLRPGEAGNIFPFLVAFKNFNRNRAREVFSTRRCSSISHMAHYVLRMVCQSRRKAVPHNRRAKRPPRSDRDEGIESMRSALATIRLSGVLCPNSHQSAWLQIGQRRFGRGHERQQYVEPIRHGMQNYDRNGKVCGILLMLEIFVDRDERAKVRRGQAQKGTVPYAAPTHFNHGLYGVAR